MDGVHDKYVKKITSIDKTLDKFEPKTKKEFDNFLKLHDKEFKDIIKSKEDEEKKHSIWLKKKEDIIFKRMLKKKAKLVKNLRMKYNV